MHPLPSAPTRTFTPTTAAACMRAFALPPSLSSSSLPLPLPLPQPLSTSTSTWTSLLRTRLPLAPAIAIVTTTPVTPHFTLHPRRLCSVPVFLAAHPPTTSPSPLAPLTPHTSRTPPSACAAGPVAHRLARAFVEACQPGRKPYAAALRDFCDSALDAYRRGYSLRALHLELSAAAGTAGTAGTAGRAVGRTLQSDELELRSVWLTLVYGTLRKLGCPGGEGGEGEAEAEVDDALDAFVGSVVGAVKAGYDMKRIQLEQSLAQGGEARNNMESAILGQSTRLVMTTITAANEDLERKREEEEEKEGKEEKEEEEEEEEEEEG